MNDAFLQLSAIVEQRRSTKPVQMTGGAIPDEHIWQLLSLANWAPNHGNTEPWRFNVYAGEAVPRFCRQHADLYKERTPAEKYDADKYNKIIANGQKASHLIVVWMQRGPLEKIRADEEMAATAAAIEHILLGATAMGYASFWGSGGMTHHPALKEMLGLRSEDVVMAMLYLGTGPVAKPGIRHTPLEQKVRWFEV